MGSIMEWKGAAPRGGSSGARILVAGAGLDHSAAEVDAAVAELERRDQRGATLAKLAQFRYLHGATIREQMHQVGLAEDADRTYRNWVKDLGEVVIEAEMVSRFEDVITAAKIELLNTLPDELAATLSAQYGVEVDDQLIRDPIEQILRRLSAYDEDDDDPEWDPDEPDDEEGSEEDGE
ncbi:hypothetical protein [Pseudomonas wadenswilerensis]|uniref:DNA packaging protein n=1 Tax=Pseudomonas wadenswilerensis TaxID=1785161 RepID=A0A380T5K9_9PSED|nr:DNA packaging protein [Pseudomonas wadenswilerensis]